MVDGDVAQADDEVERGRDEVVAPADVDALLGRHVHVPREPHPTGTV